MSEQKQEPKEKKQRFRLTAGHIPTGSFGGKGAKDGDAISIAVLFVMIFLMLNWLTTASISPLTYFSSAGFNSQLWTLSFTAFRPLLVLVIPLFVLLLIGQMYEGTGKITIERETTSKVSQRAHAFVERQKAKRLSRRKDNRE